MRCPECNYYFACSNCGAESGQLEAYCFDCFSTATHQRGCDNCGETGNDMFCVDCKNPRCDNCGDRLSSEDAMVCRHCAECEDCSSLASYCEDHSRGTCSGCGDTAYYCSAYCDDDHDCNSNTTCGECDDDGNVWRYCRDCLADHDKDAIEKYLAEHDLPSKKAVASDDGIELDGMRFVFDA